MSKDATYRIWHPYTQMQNHSPLEIARGEEAYIFDTNGNRYIDAVSSWWTNIHGHSHPYIAKAIAKQAETLEQVIFAGFTHRPAIELAEKLLSRIPFHDKIFYTDNGSTAVEAALKMTLQYWKNRGETRNKIIAFRDAYHGDTFGSMSVSSRGVFTAPYHDLLFDVVFINTPGLSNHESVVAQFKEAVKDQTVAGFIFEPLVLGSAGMLMYSAELLNELIAICKENKVIAIADEVMTGFGRTGKFLATDYCENKPDIICLSKGITGGFLPFAATTCTDSIYNAFLSEDKSKMLFHGHSYTANPLGCAAGIASLEVFDTEKTLDKINQISIRHQAFLEKIKRSESIAAIRQQGTILAIELKTKQQTGYLNDVRDKAYHYFLERGILMRPLGNVIYLIPPYCITQDDLDYIYNCISDYLKTLT